MYFVNKSISNINYKPYKNNNKKILYYSLNNYKCFYVIYKSKEEIKTVLSVNINKIKQINLNKQQNKIKSIIRNTSAYLKFK